MADCVVTKSIDTVAAVFKDTPAAVARLVCKLLSWLKHKYCNANIQLSPIQRRGIPFIFCMLVCTPNLERSLSIALRFSHEFVHLSIQSNEICLSIRPLVPSSIHAPIRPSVSPSLLPLMYPSVPPACPAFLYPSIHHPVRPSLSTLLLPPVSKSVLSSLSIFLTFSPSFSSVHFLSSRFST